MTTANETRAAAYRNLTATHVSARRVLALFKPYVQRVSIILVLIAGSSAAGVAAPFLLRAIIDDALPRGDLDLLALLAAGLIGVACLYAVIGVLEALITSKVGQAIMRDLRARVCASAVSFTRILHNDADRRGAVAHSQRHWRPAGSGHPHHR